LDRVEVVYHDGMSPSTGHGDNRNQPSGDSGTKNNGIEETKKKK